MPRGALHPGLLQGVVLFAALAVLAPTGAADGEFAAAKRTYDDYMGRPSLFMRTRGRTRFAATGHVEALRILAGSYARTEIPADRVPHLIASASARGCRRMEHVPVYQAWRTAQATPADAWLWTRSLEIECAHDGLEAVQALAIKAPSLQLQVAAVRALAAHGKSGLLALMPEMIARAPKRGVARGLYFEALAAVILSRRDVRARESFAAAARAVIERLDEKRFPLRSKIVIARHMKALFGTDDVLGINAAPWLRELEAGGGSGGGDPDGVYGPSFIGIKASGSRICYVIDASDSMLTPLSGREKEDLRPVTGDGAAPRDRLPWDRIKNRFDLAREYLRQSIMSLDKSHVFTVVLFGTEAKLLASTPGLVAANPKRIKKVMKALDAITPGPEIEDRPHGTLLGRTNLHAAMDRAFRVKDKRLMKRSKGAYASLDMLTKGCDTIFLLSDGVPSWDDYAADDRRDPEDHAGDPELGKRLDDAAVLNYYGPYVEWNGYLVDDVRRMNLIRGVEIHCIGIGEADMALLRRIAAAGLGDSKQIPAED